MLIQPFGFIGGAGEDLPLDTVTGAEIAVSLRRLRSDYQGDCMRVSDISQSNVTNIPFSGDYVDNVALQNYYNTYGSCYMFEWLDQSGNGNDFSSYATGSFNRVEVFDGNIITQNGIQTVLQRGLNMNFNKVQTGFDPGIQHSMFITATRAIPNFGYATGGRYLISGTASAARPAIISNYSADYELFYTPASNSRVTIGNDNDDNLHLLTVRFDQNKTTSTNTLDLDYDGVNTHSTSNSVGTLPGDFRTLGTYNVEALQGAFKYAEFILYKDTTLSDADTTFLNNNIVNYYGL